MKVDFEGHTHEFPDDFSDAEIGKALAGAAPAAAPQGYSAKDLAAPWDAGAHYLTGMVAAPVSGLAGIGASVVPGVSAGDTVRKVQDAMTYQPRTKLGGDLVGVADKMLSLPAQAGDAAGGAVTDATGWPLLGAGINTAIQAIPALLGSKGAAALRTGAVTRAAENSVKNATMRRGVDAGYRIPPSEMAQSPTGQAIAGTLESIGGKTAIQQDASALNNRVVNAAARNDAAIPGEGQISAADIDAAIGPHVGVYNEASAVSPTANAAVEEWRQAKFDEKMQLKFYQRSENPDAYHAAEAARARANAAAQVVENEANAVGMHDLVDRLRASRVGLGKIGTVEGALNDATGEVSADKLRQARDRGTPMQGQMGTAADMAQAFRNKLTQPSALPQGASRADAALSAVMSALKGPKMLALTGLPYIARKVLLSKPVQQAMRPPDRVLPITPAEQLNRAAIISALQLQGMPQGQVADDVTSQFRDKR